MGLEDYLKRVNEFEYERAKHELLKRGERYDPREMDCSRMPLGCWFWITGFVLASIAIAAKIVRML
jgi:hypothetical protein